MDLNRATILGRLTRDPEVRNTPSGQSVSTIGVATNRVWTDNSGVRQERVEFHDVVLWGKLAEIAGQYLSKGRRVYIEGRLQTRDWVGKDGVKRYKTEIVATNLIMLDGPRGSHSATQADYGTPPPSDPPMDVPAGDDEIRVEDIPF